MKIRRKKITGELLARVLEIAPREMPEFNGVGDAHADHDKNLLTYLKHPRYVGAIANNSSITGVICREEDVSLLPEHVHSVIHADPVYAFFRLVDFLGSTYLNDSPTVVRSELTARDICISDFGVSIGRDVTIESNVTIQNGVVIEDEAIIRAGAVLGLDTFQHQRTKMGVVSPRHDGLAIVRRGAEIGSNSTISKGFSYRSTIIGEGSKLDAQVYVGHGTQTGREVFICAGARIMGHVVIGDESFVGPGAVLSSRVRLGARAKVSLGSIVTKDVGDNEVVTGNFAIPHQVFIDNLKRNNPESGQ